MSILLPTGNFFAVKNVIIFLQKKIVRLPDWPQFRPPTGQETNFFLRVALVLVNSSFGTNCKGAVINYREGGGVLQNEKNADLNLLCLPPPPRDRIILLMPLPI